MSKLLLPAFWVILGLAVILGAVVWLSGGFEERIAPGRLESDAAPAAPADGGLPVVLVSEPAVEWASGALASARQTAVSSRILARIEEVLVAAGDSVAAGDRLILLDAREYEARRRQADEALRGARARLDLAVTEKDRAEALLQRGTGTRQRLDQAVSELRIAQSEVDRLEQALSEAETLLSHTVIQSPVSGRVIDRLAEPGDLASPGAVLLRIYDPTVLRVEAPVRETLAVTLRVGEPLTLEIPALDQVVQGTIDEIVPYADPGARTFLVKVALPADPALFAGMYARVAVPAGTRNRLLLPESAIQRIGQLEYAFVVTPDGRVQRRLVTTGEGDAEGRVEVLSGLTEGERVVPTVQTD